MSRLQCRCSWWSMQAGAVRHGPGTPIDRLRSRRMTPDDATAGPSSAPLSPPVQPKAASPTRATAPIDKENMPEADAKPAVQGQAAMAQHLSGHNRTPCGHDAMTRDMGNLQLNSANRQDQDALSSAWQRVHASAFTPRMLSIRSGCLGVP